MNKLTRLGIPLTLTALVLIAGLSSNAQQNVDWESVEITTHHVAGTVHYVAGQGGNIGLSIGEDGTLIVDDQFAQLGGKILKAIQALGGNNPKLVLNTHFHGDHTGSNPQFGRSGTIVAHDNVRVRLLSTDDFPRSGLPVVTYDQDATVHFNESKWL